ncbi:MAG TPA: hypothetical protein VLB50_03420, partial [Ignavibacteriaceae bacterium]|nr:hypothetical protein [Ignavibacteriaceae bacterium]
MMRKQLNILLISIFSLLISNCSTRNETPLIKQDDGSVFYAPKDANGINAEIILYRGIDESTGLPIIKDAFTTSSKSKVYAEIKLKNYQYHRDKDLMLHIDWIDPDGNSFFRKRLDILPGDSLPEIKSAIAVQPEKRDTGLYKLRVYLFREQIAEKNFLLTSYNVDSAKVFPADISKRISAKISFIKKNGKENGTISGNDDVFMIKDKAKARASINLLNGNLYQGKELDGDILWVDNRDSTVFDKSFHFSSNDTISEIKSSISINNESRQPGKYKLKVYLYNNLIGEQPFELIPEQKEKPKVNNPKGIKAEIIFAGKFDKKSNKYINVSDNFKIKDKAK